MSVGSESKSNPLFLSHPQYRVRSAPFSGLDESYKFLEKPLHHLSRTWGRETCPRSEGRARGYFLSSQPPLGGGWVKRPLEVLSSPTSLMILLSLILPHFFFLVNCHLKMNKGNNSPYVLLVPQCPFHGPSSVTENLCQAPVLHCGWEKPGPSSELT